VLPGFDQHSVIVPGSQIKWLTDQPDDVLSAAAMQRDSIQTDYSLLDPAIARHNFQEVCIRRDLTRSLGGLIPEIEEELNVSADKYWGTDGNGWNDVCVYGTDPLYLWFPPFILDCALDLILAQANNCIQIR
jgi:hypothetical protein